MKMSTFDPDQAKRTIDEAIDARAIYTYSNHRCGPRADAPSIRDISVQLGRICRYAGACVRYWPVLLHCMLVADLIEKPEFKIYGLLHDSPEVLTGDVPKPFKPKEMSELEDFMFDKILKDMGIPTMTEEIHKVVKRADSEALYGEVWTVGNAGLRKFYAARSSRAERMIVDYCKQYDELSCIRTDGIAIMEFTQRYREYRDILNLPWVEEPY